MKYVALPESTHPPVELRLIEASDIDSWYAYLSVLQVVQHTSWNLRSSSELLPYVLGQEPITETSRLRLAIALRTSGQLVGTIGFHTVSVEKRSAEVAYDLSPSFWGKGLASYVCRLLVTWAHQDIGFIRVQATVLQSNLPSMKVLERCGFVREGLLQSYRMVRGQSGNFFMYSKIAQRLPAA